MNTIIQRIKYDKTSLSPILSFLATACIMFYDSLHSPCFLLFVIVDGIPPLLVQEYLAAWTNDVSKYTE